MAKFKTPFKPTRFPMGITNSDPNNALSNYAAPDPTRLVTFFDDFLGYTAADWTVAGTPTTALSSALNGVLGSTAGATAASFRLTADNFALTPNKQAFFEIRLSASAFNAMGLYAGLINGTSTDATATDGVYFYKAAAATSFSATVRQDATTGATNVTNLTTPAGFANNTFFTLGFFYNGKDEVKFFINDGVVASVPVTALNIPNLLLRPVFGFSVDTNSVAVDYIFAAQER